MKSARGDSKPFCTVRNCFVFLSNFIFLNEKTKITSMKKAIKYQILKKDCGKIKQQEKYKRTK